MLKVFKKKKKRKSQILNLHILMKKELKNQIELYVNIQKEFQLYVKE